jgi:serine/threonine protein kinase
MNLPDQLADHTGSGEQALAILIDQLTARLQAGEPVDVAAYLQQHPAHAERLQALLPALRMLADLARSAPLDSASGVPLAIPPDDLTGTLGDFRILREVGRGGMGVVYEAEQISLCRRVALKVLPFAATMDPRHLQRFQNEARAAASLEHPHIVPVYGVGCERGVHYYAMKFIDGQSLAQLLAATRQLSEPRPSGNGETQLLPDGRGSDTTSPLAAFSTQHAPRDAAAFRQIAEWGIQAAEALEHAHSVGIVHRDVKPANLMIDSQGQLWVTDFGLARTAADAGLTMTGDVLGTLRYMSPEQALAKHGLVDHRTDVYSLGVTLYELLTLEPAFGGADRQELLRQVAFDEPWSPRQANKAIPVELGTVVLKAMEKNPPERYATAREFGDDLRRFLRHEPIRAKRPNVMQKARKWAQRYTSAVVATALVLVLALAGLAVGTYLLWQEEAKTRAALAKVEEQRITALRNEETANALRRQSELDLDKALNTLGATLGVLDKKELAELPGIARVRQELAAYVLRHYQSYLDEQSTDPEIRHRTTQTYRSIGLMYSYQGEPDKARDALVKAVTLSEALTREFPEEARYWEHLAHQRFYLAGVLAGQGLKPQAAEELRKAVDAFETAARCAPDNAKMLNNLAWHLATSDVPTVRNPARAVVLARRAVELGPDNCMFWDTLGVAYYRTGNWTDAVTALERRVALVPPRITLGSDIASTWFYLAMANSRLGKDENARTWHDKAVQWMDKNAPQDEWLRPLRAEAAELLGIKDRPPRGTEGVLPK